MTSVDELFRKANAPLKRKLEDPTASFSRLSNKSAKVNGHSSPHDRKNGTSKPTTLPIPTHINYAAVVEEYPRDDDKEGPALPPDDDLPEEEPGSDDEGRFFGSGVTESSRAALDYVDKNEAPETEEKLDGPWLRRTAISFERKINRNAELRAKYSNDPMKFVGSEADLDTEIKGLSVLAEHGELYGLFVDIGTLGSLVGLLAHENTDIAIAACEVLVELTDEDTDVPDEAWEVLVKAMLDADVVDLLTSNLNRLDEALENDRAGIYHVLNVFENIISSSHTVSAMSKNSKSLLSWLLKRVSSPDQHAPGKISQNRQYATEMLSILLQSSSELREQFSTLKDTDVIDTILQLLAPYRNKDPSADSDEEELIENLFGCLTSLVSEASAAQKFLDDEGMELCLIMLREGKFSKHRALRVLDHAMSGRSGPDVCVRFVESQGLKTIFGMFMRKKSPREEVDKIIGIIGSMLRYLPAESPERIRLLAKFVENDYEKMCRLGEIRSDYRSRLAKVENEIENDRKGKSSREDGESEDREDEYLSRRMDAGLFVLQSADVVLAWLTAEDKGARKKVQELLQAEGGLDVVKRSLQEQINGIEVQGIDEVQKDTMEMLEALVQCI